MALIYTNALHWPCLHIPWILHAAWYKCGDPGENYTESECLLTYPDNSTATFDTWLSSTSEYEWFGVTCSADGVVRGVDLKIMI